MSIFNGGGPAGDACLTNEDVDHFVRLVEKLKADLAHRDYLLWLAVRSAGGEVLVPQTLVEDVGPLATLLVKEADFARDGTVLRALIRSVEKSA